MRPALCAILQTENLPAQFIMVLFKLAPRRRGRSFSSQPATRNFRANCSSTRFAMSIPVEFWLSQGHGNMSPAHSDFQIACLYIRTRCSIKLLSYRVCRLFCIATGGVISICHPTKRAVTSVSLLSWFSAQNYEQRDAFPSAFLMVSVATRSL